MLLGGCSALGFAYGRGPALGQWWLNRYADFDAGQVRLLRGGLDQWFDWHRREQLPDDLALLERAAHELAADITPAQACGWWATFERKRDRDLLQMTPAVVELAATLTPEQLGQIQRRFDKTNADWRDENLQVTPRERERAAVDRVIDRLESVYGRLDADQRLFVGERVRRTVWDAQRGYTERLARQQDTLQTLQKLRTLAQSGGDPAARLAVAQAWVTRAFAPMDDSARAYRAQLLDDQCRFAADFHNRSNPAQRSRAAATLRGWANELAGYVLPAP